MASSVLFGMTLIEEENTTAEAGIQAIQSMMEAAEEAGLSGMSLDEINAEIAATRSERRIRNVKKVVADNAVRHL